MNTDEFNALLKGQFINNPFYKKYYQDNSVKISGETLEDIVIKDIENCPYNICLENIEFSGNMRITGGAFKRIELSKVKFANNEGIWIDNTSIQSLIINKESKINLLRFAGKSKLEGVSISNSDVDMIFTTEWCEFGNFSLTQTNIKHYFTIWSGIFDSINISNNSVGDAKITYISTLDFKIKSLNLSGGASVGKIYLRRGTCDNIIIDSPEVKEITTTWLKDSKFETPLVIKRIELKNVGRISMTLSDIEVAHIKFNKYFAAKESSFSFINLKINKLEFDNYINLGEFTLANLTMIASSELMINNADLGKMSFFNSDIKHTKLSFNSSKITGIFISRTEIPDRVTSTNDEIRSFYSQIKKVYEAKGDLVTSGYFYSKEMDYYSKSLSLRRNAGEKINVLLNKFSSNHGQSWVQGLRSSFLICFSAYIIYIFLLGFRLSMEPGSGDTFIRLWAYFLEFINPVHKADAIASALNVENPSSYAIFWEGFSRIPIAYFIYQLIQAFRKHGRK